MAETEAAVSHSDIGKSLCTIFVGFGQPALRRLSSHHSTACGDEPRSGGVRRPCSWHGKTPCWPWMSVNVESAGHFRGSASLHRRTMRDMSVAWPWNSDFRYRAHGIWRATSEASSQWQENNRIAEILGVNWPLHKRLGVEEVSQATQKRVRSWFVVIVLRSTFYLSLAWHVTG